MAEGAPSATCLYACVGPPDTTMWSRGREAGAGAEGAVPADKLDEEVEALARRIASVPQNQLTMQKLMVNQAPADIGLATTQMIARCSTLSPAKPTKASTSSGAPGLTGWKQAVEERDQGTFDWTTYEPMKRNR
jgi:enoyl-CoA hydratase